MPEQIKQQSVDLDALDLEALDEFGQEICLFANGANLQGAEWAYPGKEAREIAKVYGEQTAVKQPTRGGRS